MYTQVSHPTYLSKMSPPDDALHLKVVSTQSQFLQNAYCTLVCVGNNADQALSLVITEFYNHRYTYATTFVFTTRNVFAYVCTEIWRCFCLWLGCLCYTQREGPTTNPQRNRSWR